MGSQKNIMLISGGNPSLLSEEVLHQKQMYLNNASTEVNIDEFYGEYSMAELLSIIASEPLFGGERLVLARDISQFDKEDIRVLADVVVSLDKEDFLLILEIASSNPLKLIADAIKGSKNGEHIKVKAPDYRSGENWVKQQAENHNLKLSRSAIALISSHLGDENDRVAPLMKLLLSTYGENQKIDTSDVSPYVGASGGAPPWDLTDAIDKQNPSLALKVLQKLLGAGWVPLQVMSVLSNHYESILALHQSGARSPQEAANILGIKGSVFKAKKALSLSSRTRHERLKKSIKLIAQADIDLRGGTSLDDRYVVELLVLELTGDLVG